MGDNGREAFHAARDEAPSVPAMGQETIFALSSGQPPSGVAVIRLSGDGVKAALRSIAGSLPAPRQMQLTDFRDSSGRLLDRGLAVFFPGPASFTGEDCAELHLHGGKAVVQTVLGALSDLDGFRMAEPGEFTRRAFVNGKMDLTAAEGIGDLVAAETETQRQWALQRAEGGLADLFEGWRTRIIECRAMIEAELDFADEEDAPDSVRREVLNGINGLAFEITAHLNDARPAEILRDGFTIVVLGPPNAGKSTLLNAIARREVAIVSDQPGTTRDLIEVHLDLDGFPVRIVDTAGLREADNAVEHEGIARALKRASQAQLILLLADGTEGKPFLTQSDWMGDVPDGIPVLRYRTKSDLRDDSGTGEDDIPWVSTRTGEGLDGLMRALGECVQAFVPGESRILVTERQRGLLNAALDSVRAASAGESDDLEIVAEHLRYAGNHLGRLTGRIDVEDMLDVIFSRFCIGK